MGHGQFSIILKENNVKFIITVYKYLLGILIIVRYTIRRRSLTIHSHGTKYSYIIHKNCQLLLLLLLILFLSLVK